MKFGSNCMWFSNKIRTSIKSRCFTKKWHIVYHKLYAYFWHTSLNFSFGGIISRSISSSILLEGEVCFADYISIIWFDRSVKNVVKCISHCCKFIAFHTTSWNYRLILSLLDVYDQINFLLSALHLDFGK